MKKRSDGKVYFSLVLFVLAVAMLSSIPLFSEKADNRSLLKSEDPGEEISEEQSTEVAETALNWLLKFYETGKSADEWLSSLEPITGPDYFEHMKQYMAGELDWRDTEEHLINAKVYIDNCESQSATIEFAEMTVNQDRWQVTLSASEFITDESGMEYEIARVYYLAVTEESGGNKVVNVISSY